MVAGSDYEMENFKQDMPDYDIGFLPFPKGPSASSYHSHNTIPNYLTIPSAVEHPERLVYIYEKINDIDSIYDYPKQSTLETLFSNENDIQNAKMAGESIKVIDTESGYPSMPYYEFIGKSWKASRYRRSSRNTKGRSRQRLMRFGKVIVASNVITASPPVILKG